MLSMDVSPLGMDITMNGRRFRLEEYTLAETGQFMDALNAAVASEMAIWQNSDAAGTLEQLYDRVASSLEGVIALILRNPYDKEPVSPDFIASLTQHQRRILLENQSRLNGLEDEAFAKKVAAVLQMVSAWRIAVGLAPLPGTVLTASENTTASTPAPLKKRGLRAKLLALCDMLRGRNGGKTKGI